MQRIAPFVWAGVYRPSGSRDRAVQCCSSCAPAPTRHPASHIRFEATRELLARFAEGHIMGVAMSLTHGGARRDLYITPGCPSPWWSDEFGRIRRERRLRLRGELL
ncbi:hypothetical protein FXW78_24275 [Rhodococcus opacus]|nr:hypothetical protein [Rhodococcus opacus]